MSEDFLAALGLVFVIEGLVWALFPGFARHLVRMAEQTGESQLRIGGLVAVAFGVLVVWLIRG